MESGDGQVMQLPVTEGGINEETAPGKLSRVMESGEWVAEAEAEAEW